MSEQKVIIIGAGLGGLVCGAILAKEGIEVTLVEKNPRVGGCLQSYSRYGSIFDTGMHVFGGMHEGGNIRKIFDYLGVTDSLHIHNLDSQNDVEIFIRQPEKRYNLSFHRDKFIDSLGSVFPLEKSDLETYRNKIDEVISQMSLFDLKPDKYMPLTGNPDFLMPANKFIRKYIRDERLGEVLAAINVLYAGEADITPAFLHSSVARVFFNGACRIAGGYETLANSLASVITDNGGNILVGEPVVRINTLEGNVVSVSTAGGTVARGDIFIFASPVTSLEKLLDNPSLLSRSYKSFISSKQDSLSSFIVNIKLKKNSISYNNRVGFYLESFDTVWNNDNGISLDKFTYMTPPVANQGDFADTLNIVAPLKWSLVEKWQDSSHSTRDDGYREFKHQLVDIAIKKLSAVYPSLPESIEAVDSATPLSIRDFTGVRHGAMCGLRKDCNDAIPFIPLHTKVPNLLLTGQSINMHGFCGVSLTAVQTCEAILGKDYLINKLN